MNQHSKSDSKQKLNINVFCDYVNANSNAVYEQWQQAQQSHYNLNIISLSDQSTPSSPMYFIINSQTLTSIIAQVITQIITQQPSSSSSVINLFSLLSQATASVIY